MTTIQATDLKLDRVWSIQENLIRQILKQVNKAAVFADEQFMEWFHLALGIDRLLSVGGAQNINDFNRFQVYFLQTIYANFILIFLPFILINILRAIQSV
jgi:hypothetical protein